jgi:hypothetical protein
MPPAVLGLTGTAQYPQNDPDVPTMRCTHCSRDATTPRKEKDAQGVTHFHCPFCSTEFPRSASTSPRYVK